MARPKKEKELKRSHLITLRLSDVEYETITTAAEEAGLNVSSYIRKMLSEGKINIKYQIAADTGEIQKLATEFSRIGNNLNQIAKFFNMGGVRSMAMQNEIHQCITELHDLRNEVIKLGGDYRGYSETHSK